MNDHHALITQLCAELDHCRRMLLDDRQVTHPLADRARAALAADGPAVPEGREPASVVGEPSDAELLELMPQQFRDDLATVSRLASYGTPVEPGIYRVSLNTGALDFARAVLARWGTPNQAEIGSSLGAAPAPPDEGEVGELVAKLRRLSPLNPLGTADPTITRAADLLAQRHPAPVLMSELVDLAHELRKTSEYLRGGCGWNKAVEAIERAVDLIEGGALQRFAPVPMRERPWERKGWCDERGCCWWANKYPPFRWEYVNRAAVIDGVMLPATALPLPAFWGGDCDKTSTSVNR